MKKSYPQFGGLDLPSRYLQYERAKIVLLPVPYDKTASYKKGARNGPKAILKASDYLEWYDLETKKETYKNGIYTAPDVIASSPEDLVKKVYVSTKKYLDENKFVITLGGEHSVSIGAINAHFEKFENISILHLDAHSDRRDIYKNSKYSHACVMARANELTNKISSVGIRAVAQEELPIIGKNAVFYAEEIQKSTIWIEKVIKNLNSQVYVTIDLDVFDPSIMPATGTPEPGGLDWYQVTSLLRKVAQNKEIIGFDVVELSPIPSLHYPDFLTAKLIYQLLSYIFANHA